ncbi:MAG: Signal peptidase I T [Verrucomicrobia subdivision 3 bacterium]|nr:Signal peptidase I T [Limisphaerales bacterium]
MSILRSPAEEDGGGRLNRVLPLFTTFQSHPKAFAKVLIPARVHAIDTASGSAAEPIAHAGKSTNEQTAPASQYRLLLTWGRLVHEDSAPNTRFRMIGLTLGALILRKFCLVPIRSWGSFPTYRPGEINYINRFAFKGRVTQRGEVVSISITSPQANILKRVLGLPSEVIRMRDGSVCVNGELDLFALIKSRSRQAGRFGQKGDCRDQPGGIPWFEQTAHHTTPVI